jgi:hypothetical protein
MFVNVKGLFSFAAEEHGGGGGMVGPQAEETVQ